MKGTKFFKAVKKGHYFRLTHIASGDYVQKYLCDFSMRKDAIACRERMIAAAPDFDWSNPELFNAMPADLFDKVWAAIYAR